MSDTYRELIRGTTIDPNTYLSTDYFNHFNEVIMLLGMLGDMPDMLEEIEIWEFKTYQQHFAASGLAFAQIAIDVYPQAPEMLRLQFEDLVEEMREIIEKSRIELRDLIAAERNDEMADKAAMYCYELQQKVDLGSSVVHGVVGALDQSAIDDLF